MKVLIVEDDPDIAQLLEYHVGQAGYDTIVCADGAQVTQQVDVHVPALLLLDVMLPGKSGFELCRELKANQSSAHIPIIMLTARSEEVDRVMGLEYGADDYMTKPFSPRELVLRMKAVLRRGETATQAPALLRCGILELDQAAFRVRVAGEEVSLTAIEFRLLQYLMERTTRVATRDALLNDVWGYDAALTTRTVDTHIKRLRLKLGAAGAYITTVRGVGYRFEASAEVQS